jgi:serine/threonine protein kinase
LLLGELAVLRHMSHPHLVRGLERSIAYESKALLFYLEDGGCSLHHYLATYVPAPEHNPQDLSMRLLQQILAGVSYLHEYGVLHRDIKPANMLMDGARLRLCDFGMVCLLAEGHSAERERNVVTRWYRSPEVECSLPYGPPMDLWSVGCTWAEVLRCLHQRTPPTPLFGGTHDRFDVNARERPECSQLPTVQCGLYALYRELGLPLNVLGDQWNLLPYARIAEPPPQAPVFEGVEHALLRTLLLPLLHPAPDQRLTAAQALEHLGGAPPAASPPPAPELHAWLTFSEQQAKDMLHALLTAPQ